MHSDIEYERIKKIIERDKYSSPQYIGGAVKSEIGDVLVNYMDVGGVDFRVKPKTTGGYTLAIVVNVNSFYSIKSSMIE